MLKVLYLTSNPSPYRVDFFNELSNSCDLTVAYEKKKLSHRHEKWTNNVQVRFKEIYLKSFFNSSLCLSIIPYLNKSYDVIVVGGYSTLTGMLAIQWLKLRRIPFILNVDGGFIKNDNKILFFIKRYFISSAYTWLSTSEKTTQYLLHYGAKKDKIHVYPFTSIRNSEIIQSILSEDEKKLIKSKLNIKEEKVILSVGQFIHRKGFDILIKAMRELPDNYGIYIIGGKATQEYLEMKKKYSLENLYFIDFMNKKELEEYYLAADLFAFPTREDIWGLVINEAMAKGLPVITTDRCMAGLELIREGSNGFIVPVEDINELAFKTKVILEDNKLRENMKKESLKTISKYTIEEMTIRHLEIFQEIKRK